MVHENMRKIRVWPSCMVEEEDVLWIMHGKANVLLKYDLSMQSIGVEAVLQDEEWFQECLVENICMVDEKIYLFPATGKLSYCYDKTTQKVQHLDFPKQVNDNCIVKFSGIKAIGNNIYIFPSQYPWLLKYNTQSGSFEKIADTRGLLEKYGMDKNLYVSGLAQIGNRLVSVVEGTNYLRIFYMESEKIDMVEVGGYDGGFYDVVSNNGRVVLSTDRGEVVLLSEDFEIQMKVDCLGIDFFSVQPWGDYFAISSADDGRILIADYEGHIRSRQNNLSGRESESFCYSYHHGLGLRGSKRDYFYNRHDNCLWIIKNNEIVDEIVLEICFSDVCYDSKKVIYEREIGMLEWWLNQKMKRMELKNQGNIGTSVYKYMELGDSAR